MNILIYLFKVVRKGTLKEIVKTTFDNNKSGGYEKIYTSGKDAYAGLSQREVNRAISQDKNLGKFSVKFTNKANTPSCEGEKSTRSTPDRSSRHAEYFSKL